MAINTFQSCTVGKVHATYTAACYGLDVSGFEPQWNRNHPHSFNWPWFLRSLLFDMSQTSVRRVKRKECGVENPWSSRAEVKERASLHLYFSSVI